MSKKLDLYEAALKEISKMTGRDFALGDAVDVAMNALTGTVVDHEAERRELAMKVRDFMIAKGIIFASAAELADELNKVGITTARGKEWSKSTATRLLTDVRVLVANAFAPKMAEPAILEKAEAVPKPADPKPATQFVQGDPRVTDDMEELLTELDTMN